jgi:hypothetical protein
VQLPYRFPFSKNDEGNAPLGAICPVREFFADALRQQQGQDEDDQVSHLIDSF